MSDQDASFLDPTDPWLTKFFRRQLHVSRAKLVAPITQAERECARPEPPFSHVANWAIRVAIL